MKRARKAKARLQYEANSKARERAEEELRFSYVYHSRAYAKQKLELVFEFIEARHRASLPDWRRMSIQNNLEFWAGSLLNERPGATEREAKRMREKAHAAIASIEGIKRARGTSDAARYAEELENQIQTLKPAFSNIDRIEWRTLADVLFILERELRDVAREFEQNGLQVRIRRESSAKRGRHEHVWLTGILELWENLGFSRSERIAFRDFCRHCRPVSGASRPVWNAGPIRKRLAPIGDETINTFYRSLNQVRQE